jgi:hypothetical protein
MKYRLFALFIICLVSLRMSGCRSFCVLGFCSTDGLEVNQQNYDPINKTYLVAGNLNGQYTSYSFKLGDKQSIEKLSFGIEDATTFKQYTAIKKIHILDDSAIAAYYEKYVIPKVGCPASFMNQNLQNLLLLPVSKGIAKQLEQYDIPFDGKGTRFKLTGHYLTPDSAYFLKSNGEKWTLGLIEYEDVFSNIGSAQRKVHYFLVTAIDL